MSEAVTILVIDDEADDLRNRVAPIEENLRAGVTVCDPDEVTRNRLDRADLVLVDYKLDKWNVNRDEMSLCQWVPNGIALAGVLQQHANKCERPTAFAIHSAHLGELTRPFKPEPRVHLLARTYNLDWAFVKSSASTPPIKTFEQANILAKAVTRLPRGWPAQDPDRAREIARGLLSVPSGELWGEQAWEDVEQAHPPLDEMTLPIHGILFLRWLLTRVLFYPCFLLDRYWIAARLGATLESVEESLSGTLGEFLASARYTGILEGFDCDRWWRGGVESLLWDLTGGTPVGTADLQRLLKEKFGLSLTPTSHSYPVVCLDENYKPLPELYDPSRTVRLQLDDWPSHAEIPRTTLEKVQDNPHMLGLVLAADRDLVEN
jgi:hypothetical protein